MNVRLSKEQKIKIANSEDIYNIMHAVLMRQTRVRRRQEYFWTIGLNTGNDIMYIELIALGKLNAVNVDPVEVLSIAVQKRCKRIILIHNHPSGQIQPSTADYRITQIISEGAKALRMEVLDHLIITEENGYYSMLDTADLLFLQKRLNGK